MVVEPGADPARLVPVPLEGRNLIEKCQHGLRKLFSNLGGCGLVSRQSELGHPDGLSVPTSAVFMGRHVARLAYGHDICASQFRLSTGSDAKAS